jgi:murein tripeptide amidase MpaA
MQQFPTVSTITEKLQKYTDLQEELTRTWQLKTACIIPPVLSRTFRPHNGPGVDSASNRNDYQEYFLGE